MDHQWIDTSRMPELGRETHSLEPQLGDVLAFDLKIILSETVVAVNHPTVVVVDGRAVRLCRTKGTLLGIDAAIALHLCGRIISNPLDAMEVNHSSGIWVGILIFKHRPLGLKLVLIDRGDCRLIHG